MKAQTAPEADEAKLVNAGHVRAILAIVNDGVRIGINQAKHFILLGRVRASQRELDKKDATPAYWGSPEINNTT